MTAGVRRRRSQPIAALLVVCIAHGVSAAPPNGFAVVPGSLSPDGKLAVIAPEAASTRPHDNKLIEVATGRVLAQLISPTVSRSGNDLQVAPRWSPDGAMLEWFVDGRYGSYAFVLVRVDHGKATQIDVRELAVREVLADVQRTHPIEAASAKRIALDAGAWFRDGLAIDVRPVGTQLSESGDLATPPPALPIALEVTYTSNPKELDDFPVTAKVDGKLALELDARGKLVRRPVYR